LRPPARKALGQHFLTDRRILARIAAAIGAEPGTPVLEIGPGRGALTEELLRLGLAVTAIEKDRLLAHELAQRWPSLRLITGDALDIDWRAAVAPEPGRPWFVIGNIPYNITSPLIDKALDSAPAGIVFLIQKEVADRLAAKPGTAEYGALTVGVTAAARVEKLFTVPAGAFQPRPKIDSAVIRLVPTPAIGPRDPRFRRLVVGLFGARRKQLGRGLRTVLGIDPANAGAIAAAAGLDPIRRPETLSVDEFERLFRAVVDAGRGTALTL
jgi:16S rRNA (adenine1518-N6/adenine1519-N6)-dimethyltransferase